MRRLLFLLVVCYVGAQGVEGNNYASLEGDTLVKGLGEPLGDAGTSKVVKADKEMELGESAVRSHPSPRSVG